MGHGCWKFFWVFLLVCLVLPLAFPAPSDARYDPSWEWCRVETEDFVIYYPRGHELLAQRVLSLCKEVHGDVAGYLGVKPRRCPIVLNPGTDVFNGSMEIFPSRITLFETPLYTVRGFGPGSDLMDLVFTHEYTHYAHITTKLGWYGALTEFIGDGLAVTNGLSPGWAVEGITTNTETLFTDGGRGRSPLFAGEMMSFTEGEGLWGLNSAAVASPYSPPGSRIYLGGYFMVDYLNRTYGENAFARLSRYQAEEPLGGTRQALRRVTGQDPDRFYTGFLADFNARAQRTRDAAGTVSLPRGKVVIEDPARLESFEKHYWTGSGRIVGLRQGYGRENALVEIDPATGTAMSETPTGNLPEVSARGLPDGRLVLSEIFYHPLGEGQMDTTDLVVFDPSSRKHHRLTQGAHIFSAHLSPDGRTFVATRRNGMWIDLVLLDADGGHLRTLSSQPGVYFDAPVWSRDGTRIAAVVKSGKNADIVLVNPSDGRLEPLFSPDAAEDNEPEFSPDGRWVVFSSDRSGIWNIHAWDLQEHRLYQLTSVPYVAGDPHVSPDGGTLSFSSMVRGVKQVCTIPFAPLSGKPVAVEAPRAIERPDLKRLQPEVAFEGKPGIPLSELKPFARIPYVSSDEDGTQAGLFLIGRDPVGINTYTANLLYGLESGRPGYDLNVVNRSFWPTLSARIYDTPVEGNSVGSGADFWYRERGGEALAGVSTILQAAPSVVTASFRLGPRMRYFSSLDEDIHVPDDENQSVAFYSELKLDRSPDTAPRDMVPAWGEKLFASWEKAFSKFGSEMPGYNVLASLTQYVPSPVEHHGLALTVVNQQQKGSLFYDKDLSIPRGYDDDDLEGDLYQRKNLLLTAEYHFPIVYTDTGIGVAAYHSNLVKGSVFVDYGAGWDGSFDWQDWNEKARTSIGGTLTNRCVLLAILPIEFGIEAGYKTHEHEGFLNILLMLQL